MNTKMKYLHYLIDTFAFSEISQNQLHTNYNTDIASAYCKVLLKIGNRIVIILLRTKKKFMWYLVGFIVAKG